MTFTNTNTTATFSHLGGSGLLNTIAKPSKKKSRSVPDLPTFHKARVNLRANGYGLHFLNQVDFSILEALDNFEHDKEGCFTIRNVSDYLGLSYATIRNSLNKLCNYQLLFATVREWTPINTRIRYGYYDAHVDKVMKALKVIRKNQYFGLRPSEQNIVMVVKVLACNDENFSDLGEITSSVAPDLFARCPLIYQHAREDQRFLVSEKYQGNTLGFSATKKGYDVYVAWAEFTDLVSDWQKEYNLKTFG